MSGMDWQRALMAAGVGVATGGFLYHPQSPFARLRRDYGRREEPLEVPIQLAGAAAVSGIILCHKKTGVFSLATPQDIVHVAIGLTAVAAALEIPNVITEKRDLTLFTLNRLHDLIAVGAIAFIIRQLH